VGPADHLAGLRGEVGSTFSQEQCIRPTLLTTSQKAAIRGPCEIRMVKGHTRTKRGKCVVC
jgi:hypothetical protein